MMPRSHASSRRIPKGGYRLIARVSSRGASQGIAASGHLRSVVAGDGLVTVPPAEAGRASAHEHTQWRLRTLGLWAVGLAVVILVAIVAWPWVGADTQLRRVTIAVLPFEHIGGPEREYLTDGLTEELGLFARPDRPRASREGPDIDQALQKHSNVGREDRAGAGRRVSGGRVRPDGEPTAARHVEADSRARRDAIWAESYDSEPGSMLELQRELSAAIARQIRLRLSPEWLTALAPRHTRNAAAYDAYINVAAISGIN